MASSLWAPRSVVAGGLLAAVELTWLLERGAQPSALQVAILVACSTLTATILQLVVLAILAQASRLLGDRPAWAAAMLSLPLAGWAAESLFSGKKISQVQGILLVKVAFALLLVGSAAVAVVLHRRAERVETPRNRWLLAGALAAIAATGGWVDSHLQVGLYPAFHWLLAAGIVEASMLAAALLLPPRSTSTAAPPVTWAAWLFISAAVGLTVGTWRGLPSMELADSSGSLFTRTREVVQLATNSLGFNGADEQPPGDVSPFAGAAAWRETSTEFAPTESVALVDVRSKIRGVVFVLCDGMRADHLGGSPHGVPLTPFYDDWRSQVTTFASCYSPADHTHDSIVPILTSIPRPVVETASRRGWKLDTWIRLLREQGFRTYGNGNCDLMKRHLGEPEIEHSLGLERSDPKFKGRRGFVRQIVDFIDEDPEAPFAVYTHWMDTHVLGSNLDNRMIHKVAAGTTTVDERMGMLVDGLREIGVYDETLIVWTADHGWALGEHDRYMAHHGAMEAVLRIPLVLSIPGLSSGRTITPAVSNLALVPTLLDLLAPDVQTPVGASSLLGMLVEPGDSAASAPHPVFAETSTERMVRLGDHKLVVNRERGTSRLYDLASDPGELHPVDVPPLRAELQAYLAAEDDRHRALRQALTERAASADSAKAPAQDDESSR